MGYVNMLLLAIALIRAAWPLAIAIKRKADTWQAENLSLATTNYDLWPPGSIIDPKGRGCTHAGSAPCRYHGKHIH